MFLYFQFLAPSLPNNPCRHHRSPSSRLYLARLRSWRGRITRKRSEACGRRWWRQWCRPTRFPTLVCPMRSVWTLLWSCERRWSRSRPSEASGSLSCRYSSRSDTGQFVIMECFIYLGILSQRKRTRLSTKICYSRQNKITLHISPLSSH